jgi:UDPglucose 6-dehydrogenase
MDIGIVGAGYVGLVTGACFAETGNKVTVVDNDADKVALLTKGKIPIYEPGLGEMVARNGAAGRLVFTGQTSEAVDRCTVVFICVGTPPKANGQADLSYIEQVAREIARHMTRYTVVVEKSTVPVQTGEWVRRTIRLNNRHGVDFDVVSNPEFLREGSAICDSLYPDRIVVGVESDRAAKIMRELYDPIIARSFPNCAVSAESQGEVPFLVTDVRSAELIKHASNSFLALKISFVNAVANICDLSGADVLKVAEGMGYDRRIGRSFLNAGAGFGGSCFPKDVLAFHRISAELGYDFRLLDEINAINAAQRKVIVDKVRKALWILKDKTIGVLGLSFKPDTDDMREAPSVEIIRMLQEEGANIKAYDPAAMDKAKAVLPHVVFCADPYEVARDSDTLVVLTEWEEFSGLDLERTKELLNYPILVDGRNIFDPARMRELGFEYVGVGRGSVG